MVSVQYLNLNNEVSNSESPLLGQTFLQGIIETFEETTTSDPETKAKIQVKRIDQLILKLQKLLSTDKSGKAVDEGINIIKEIGQKTDIIAKNPKLKTDREVIALQIEQYNRLQLILQQLQEAIPLNDSLRIEDARQKYLVSTAVTSINEAPSLEIIHNIALKEVTKFVGEDFAHLKAIEIISDFEDRVKPEARGKLLGLEKELAHEFENKMLKFSREEYNRKLQNYIHYSFGDPLLQIKSLNRIKDSLSDRELILGVDSLKEVAMKRLTDRIFELDNQEDLNQFTDRVLQNPQDIKILSEMQMAVNTGKDEVKKQKLAQMEQSVTGRIAQFFNEKELDQLESYFNPTSDVPTDLLDVVMVSNLQRIITTVPTVSTEKKQKFADMKTRTYERFIQEITDKNFLSQSRIAYNPVPTNSDVRILLSNPGGISLLQMLQREASPEDKAKIDVALRAQSVILQEHLLLQVQDPEIFEDYTQFINNDLTVKQTLQKYVTPNFFSTLSQKSKTLQQATKADKQHLYEVIQQITQAIFITKETTEFERQFPTDIRQQISVLKGKLSEKSIPRLTVPDGVTLQKFAKLPLNVERAIVQAAKGKIKEKATGEDVKTDLKVQAMDLGVSDPWMLPDNPFYWTKNVIRAAQLIFTFDPLSRAELLVKQNNERTLEAAKLIEKDNSRKAVTLALGVLADVQRDFNKLKANAGRFNTLRQNQPERVDRLVNAIIKNGLTRQTIFSAISSKVYGKDYVQVEKIRQNILKDGVDSLLQLTGGNVETLVAKLETAVVTGAGSKFKELKAIELLAEIRRFQPKEVDLLLENSEVRLVKQFEAKLLAMEKRQRESELLAYAEYLPGNPVRQFQAYAHMEESFDNPEILLLFNHSCYAL